MADNRLELVVEVDTNRANASLKSVNASLSSMEASAVKTARGAAQGIDGMTAAMVKGATDGNLLADAIKSALTWAKEFTVGSVMMAAENAKAEASLEALANAHGVGAAAAARQVAAIEEIGFEYTEAAHDVQRLIVARSRTVQGSRPGEVGQGRRRGPEHHRRRNSRSDCDGHRIGRRARLARTGAVHRLPEGSPDRPASVGARAHRDRGEAAPLQRGHSGRRQDPGRACGGIANGQRTTRRAAPRVQ